MTTLSQWDIGLRLKYNYEGTDTKTEPEKPYKGHDLVSPEKKAVSGHLRIEYQRVACLSPISLSSVSAVVCSNDDIQMKKQKLCFENSYNLGVCE